MTAPHASGQPQALALGLALALLSLAGLLLGTSLGSTGFESVLQAGHDAVAAQIVWDIRLPRTLGAWLAGALLGLAGAVAQGLFRNPLADPYLLGSASGASLGVAVMLVLVGGLGMAHPSAAALVMPTGSWGAWGLRLGVTGAAFAGAVVAVALTLALARGVQQTLRLLLAGVVVGVVLGALGSLLMQLRPDIMPALQSFLLGSTAYVSWPACALMLGAWLLCQGLAWGLAPVLDGLSLGEATASSLGLRLPPLRALLVAVLALATGTAVAQTGLIGFVGLAAPHLVRSWVKGRHSHLLFLSALMGGLLLLWADILARSLIAPQELPVGVLTAVVGGGYLLWLMHRSSGRSMGQG